MDNDKIVGGKGKHEDLNVKDKIDSFMPDKAADDPKQMLKSDKKLYSAIFVAIVVLSVLSCLIAVIIGFCTNLIAGFTALFVGCLTTTVTLLLTMLLVSIAHNLSRNTKAVMLLCEKIINDDKVKQEKDGKTSGDADNVK